MSDEHAVRPRVRKVEEGTRFHARTDGIVAVLVLSAAAACALYFRLPLVFDPDASNFNPVAFVPVILCLFALKYVIAAFRGSMLGRRFGRTVMEMEGETVAPGATLRGVVRVPVDLAPDVDDVVMDEFHWYADRDRGVAWQVPLVTLPRTRFLLMSATLGDVAFFAEDLTRSNGLETAVVRPDERPVPLDYAYSEILLPQTLEKLVAEDKAPVYVVSSRRVLGGLSSTEPSYARRCQISFRSSSSILSSSLPRGS